MGSIGLSILILCKKSFDLVSQNGTHWAADIDLCEGSTDMDLQWAFKMSMNLWY